VREAFTHLRADYSVDQLVLVVNHIGDGYACAYTSYRQSFCGVTGTPTYLVDYIYKHVGGAYTWEYHYNIISAWVDAQLAKTAPCTIDITYDALGGGKDPTGTFYAVALVEKGDGTKEVVQAKQITLTGVTDPDSVVLHTTVTLDTDITGSYKVWMMVFEEPVSTYHFVVRGGTHPPIVLDISDSGESITYDWSNDTNDIQPTSLGHVKTLFR